MADRLTGKVAIVTGGGSYGDDVGTGRATAVCLAREGAKVLVADINEANAMNTVEAVRADSGGDATTFVGDATCSSDSRAMIESAVERYGGLHVLVNNLGFGGRSVAWGNQRGLTDLNEARWQQAIKLNLNSAMLASKHAIAPMTTTGGGSIINMSSVDGLVTSMNYSMQYGVSKGALIMLTKATAVWHGRSGIRANCIAPGHLHSAFTSHMDTELRDRRRRVTPLGTEGTPWDVAWAAVFLASDESRWISGVTIPVDGGVLAEQPLMGYEFISEEVASADTDG